MSQVIFDTTQINYAEERQDLAAAFQWSARINLHEGVANHFSLAVNDVGDKFLLNPNMSHFSRVTASNLLCLNANDETIFTTQNPPDKTAWYLHGAIHKLCPHARCVMHVHSIYATVLASLEESIIPPINQVAAMFFNRQIVDNEYGGLAFEEEGKRCAKLLVDPKINTMIMGNHGVLVIGRNVAETFNRLFYFERAAEIYIKALQTGKKLRILNDHIAEKTAQELHNEELPHPAGSAFLREIKLILNKENSNYTE